MRLVEIVDANYNAYNAGDADRLTALYAEDCVVTDLDNSATLRGRAAFRERFQKTFSDHPQTRALSVNPIAVGNVVVDHEVGERSPERDRFEVIAICTVEDGLISRLAMGRGA